MNSNEKVTISIPFPIGMLGVLFVGLKLTGHIDWSWIWVTLPFWGVLALFLGIVGVIVVGAALATAVQALFELFRPRRRRF